MSNALQSSSRDQRRALKRENAKQPAFLTQVDGWQQMAHRQPNLIEVWRSREFLVQVFREPTGVTRVSVNRASIDANTGRWQDGISWEDLQRVKREIGRGHLDAVEVFPADCDIVNVANMRHLFILDDPLPFAWRRS